MTRLATLVLLVVTAVWGSTFYLTRDLVQTVPAPDYLGVRFAIVFSSGFSEVGGAGVVKGAVRVTFWGALAMAATAAVGMIFGVTVG